MKPLVELTDAQLDAWIALKAGGNIEYSLNDGLAERERRRAERERSRALEENQRAFRIGFVASLAAVVSATARPTLLRHLVQPASLMRPLSWWDLPP